MNRPHLATIVASVLLGTLVTPALADTLFTVPVAGTLQPRRLSTVLEYDSGSASDSDLAAATVEYDWNRYFSFGGTARLTNGVTARPIGNVQFAPLQSRFAFALGIANVGVRSFRSQPYAIVSTRFDKLGTYAGITHDSYGQHPMLGADYPVTPSLIAQADWIYDDSSFFTVGGRWLVVRDFSLSAGFSHANGSNGDGVFLSAEKDFRF